MARTAGSRLGATAENDLYWTLFWEASREQLFEQLDAGARIVELRWDPHIGGRKKFLAARVRASIAHLVVVGKVQL